MISAQVYGGGRGFKRPFRLPRRYRHLYDCIISFTFIPFGLKVTGGFIRSYVFSSSPSLALKKTKPKNQLIASLRFVRNRNGVDPSYRAHTAVLHIALQVSRRRLINEKKRHRARSLCADRLLHSLCASWDRLCRTTKQLRCNNNEKQNHETKDGRPTRTLQVRFD